MLCFVFHLARVFLLCNFCTWLNLLGSGCKDYTQRMIVAAFVNLLFLCVHCNVVHASSQLDI